jgi:hypothetical protein
MNARSRIVVWGAALALLAGCGGSEEVASGAAAGAPTGSAAEPAVAVAQAIRANPAGADSILVAHGLTHDGFDSLMYDVAADAERARAYTEAMRR